jgi:hypothetical protein
MALLIAVLFGTAVIVASDREDPAPPDLFGCPHGFEETAVVNVEDLDQWTVPTETPGAGVFSFGLGHPDGTHTKLSHKFTGETIETKTIDHVHVCEHFYPPRKDWNT